VGSAATALPVEIAWYLRGNNEWVPLYIFPGFSGNCELSGLQVMGEFDFDLGYYVVDFHVGLAFFQLFCKCINIDPGSINRRTHMALRPCEYLVG
jgi:hypothetical protein